MDRGLGGPQSVGSQTVWHDWVTNISTLFFAYPYVTLVLTGYSSRGGLFPVLNHSFLFFQEMILWSLGKKKQKTCNCRWVKLFIGLVTVTNAYRANDINKLILRVYFVAPKSSFLSRASVLIKFSHHYKYLPSSRRLLSWKQHETIMVSKSKY